MLVGVGAVVGLGDGDADVVAGGVVGAVAGGEATGRGTWLGPPFMAAISRTARMTTPIAAMDAHTHLRLRRPRVTGGRTAVRDVGSSSVVSLPLSRAATAGCVATLALRRRSAAISRAEA